MIKKLRPELSGALFKISNFSKSESTIKKKANAFAEDCLRSREEIGEQKIKKHEP